MSMHCQFMVRIRTGLINLPLHKKLYISKLISIHSSALGARNTKMTENALNLTDILIKAVVEEETG